MVNPRLVIEIEAADSADGRWCFQQYFRDLKDRLRDGFDPGKTCHVAPEDIAPPNGLVVARLDGRSVGCGALKFRDGITGEVKRMWVSAEARGHGVGRRILATLVRLARERGFSALRLDTNRALKEAYALYRSSGFVDVAPFNAEPFAHH